MKHVTLEAWTRVTNGTSGATAVRNEGCIPGILIGHNEPRIAVKIKAGDMTRVLKEGGRNALLDLNIDGTSSFAMVREFTRNPVTRRIIHVDFQRVSASETVETAVPIVFVGQLAEGLVGYTVEHELNAVHVKGFPDSLPSHIDVDISTIQTTRPFTAGDIILPEGVVLAADPAQAVAMIVPPKVVAAAEETTPTATASETPA